MIHQKEIGDWFPAKVSNSLARLLCQYWKEPPKDSVQEEGFHAMG